MYPESFHPADRNMRRDWKGPARHFNRIQRPPKYYLIDFGMSHSYPPEYGVPVDFPVQGGDKTAPELNNEDQPYNPFPTDVYYLGNWVREHFIQVHPYCIQRRKVFQYLIYQKYHGFDFMEKIVDEMTQTDPTKRPNMDQIMVQYESIMKSLGSWNVRSRVVRRDENPLFSLFRSVVHLRKQVLYAIQSLPAIPLPSTAAASTSQAASPSAILPPSNGGHPDTS
jgi:hypothetical protein